MPKNHNDRPVLECQLERKQWRDRVIGQIKEADAPKVIAIHGTWGTGKTSMLAQMYVELGGTQPFVDKSTIGNKNLQPVWFEAWQYQNESNILAALLKEIRDQLVFRYKLANKLDEIATVGITSLLQSIDLTIEGFGAKFGFKGFAKNVSDNVKEYQKERIAEPLNSAMMKKMLKDAIDKLLKIDLKNPFNPRSNQRKAVIFIDDLDRCEPEVAFRILESLKIYLDLENCIFVLGMDIHAVDLMLKRRYEKQLKGDENFNDQNNISRLYLEKICQDVYHLPIVSPESRVNYLKGLLYKIEPDKSEIINKIEKLAMEFNFLPPFPRSIKILSNMILSHLDKKEITDYLAEERDEKENENGREKYFLIISYLYAFHYEVYHLIYNYPDFYNSAFLEYCERPFEYKNTFGEHPILTSLIIPRKGDSLKETSPGMDERSSKNELLQSVYPHANLRQVLWIRDLIVDSKSIPENTLEKLKL